MVQIMKGLNMESELEAKNCPFCDEVIRVNARKCKHCGEFLDAEASNQSKSSSEPAGFTAQIDGMLGKAKKNISDHNAGKTEFVWHPALAAILSFLLPGLGQLYKGEGTRGIVTIIAYIIGLFAFVVPGLVVLVWAVLDAAGRIPPNQPADIPPSD
jgi:TM2 domain-containing membrane protein YozV